MSCDRTVIDARNVTKHFLIFDRPQDRLKQMIVPKFQRLIGMSPRDYYHIFPAVTNASFEISRGETVGIVGRNGSGKSTLLQLICGVLTPTAGTVHVNGRLFGLLELAAGFNAEYTGRENIYLSAAIYGLSRTDIDERFDKIESFADIGEFIDQPVKTYSSGMYIRLAFAVAVNVDPDILVIDEALSVGDEAFQRKCFSRIEEIQDKGGTILFVTHSMQSVLQLCNRAMLIDRGEILLQGEPKEIVHQYQKLINYSGVLANKVRDEIRSAKDDTFASQSDTEGNTDELSDTDEKQAGWFDPLLMSESTLAYEARGAVIRDVRIVTAGGHQVNVLTLNDTYRIEYFADFHLDTTQIIVGNLIKSVSGLELAGGNNSFVKVPELNKVRAGETLKVSFEFICRLMPGTYLLNTGILGTVGDNTYYLHRILDVLMFRVVYGKGTIDWGVVSLDMKLDVSVCGEVAQDATEDTAGTKLGMTN